MPSLEQPVSDITVWQAIAVIVAVVAFIGWLVKRAWPVVAAVKDFLDDWKGEHARPGQPARPGVPDTLQALKVQVATLQHEVRPNGGSSLRDAIDRVEKGQYAQVKTLREHIEESTADRQALHEAINALTTETDEHHNGEE